MYPARSRLGVDLLFIAFRLVIGKENFERVAHLNTDHLFTQP